MLHSAEQPMTEREDLLETLAILTSKTERELTKMTTAQLKKLLRKALDNA